MTSPASFSGIGAVAIMLEHARAQGRRGGRPTVMNAERVAAAVQLRDAGTSTTAIARALGVGASSVTRALTRYDQQSPALTAASTPKRD